MKTLKTIGYWFVSCTWGILMTIIGAIGFIIVAPWSKKKIYKGSVISYIGHNWGGLNLGPFQFIYVEAENSRYILEHEWGHSIQNLMYGPLMPFIVAIPSAIRYWYRRIVVALGKKRPSDLPDYYSIWFEHQASELGRKLADK